MQIDGIDIYIEGNGPETIVMVHGWPDTWRLWDGQVEALKSRFRCVRFTLPGFDGTDHRARTLDELTDFLKQVVEQVSPGRKVILMLHDWGCVFGYQFYGRYPQLVSKIVGVDIGDVISVRRANNLKILLMVLAYQLPLALAWLIGGRIGNAIVRAIAHGMRCPTDPAQMSSAMAYPYYMTWFAGARSYRHHILEFRPQVPFLYLYARRKPFQFHVSEWLDWVRQRPGNEVHEFNTGHWLMKADPQRFNEAVGRWL